MISKVDSKGTTSYTYDNLERLLTVTEPSTQVTTYSYDAAGNRATQTVTLQGDTTVTEYAYNTQNRLNSYQTRLNGVTTQTVAYAYDNNGNQLTVTTTPYENGVPQTPDTLTNTYDTLNQLITTSTSGGAILTNTYNGEGKRVAKQAGASVIRYLYEGNDVILELNGSGNQLARNIWGTSLIARNVSGTVLYYMYNGHADVTALIDSSGTIQATYYYDAFGNILESTGTADNPFKYAGYQYDDETGLYYLQSRYYDPVTARFLPEDTFRGTPNDPLSLNLYTYCHNEPLMYTDPDGHSLKSIIKKATSTVKKAVTTTVKKATTTVKSTATSAASAIKKTATSIATNAKQTASTVKAAVTTTVKKTTTQVKQVATSAASTVNKAAAKVATKVSTAVSKATVTTASSRTATASTVKALAKTTSTSNASAAKTTVASSSGSKSSSGSGSKGLSNNTNAKALVSGTQRGFAEDAINLYVSTYTQESYLDSSAQQMSNAYLGTSGKFSSQQDLAKKTSNMYNAVAVDNSPYKNTAPYMAGLVLGGLIEPTGGGGEIKGLSKASSTLLRKNLINAGTEVPDYANAAHHIVAGSSPKADEARAILQKYGVDINDAANGVFLPTAKGVANSAYHPGLHTDAYYRTVSDMLSDAKSKEDVFDALGDIADRLTNGTLIK